MKMSGGSQDNDHVQEKRIAIKRDDFPIWGNAIADHTVQKMKSAIEYYNSHRYVMAIVEMSYAVEESSKLYKLSNKFMNGEDMTVKGLEKMYSHSSKISKHTDEIFTSTENKHNLSNTQTKHREALIGFVAFREYASYVEFRYGHLVSIQNIFQDEEFLKQFTYYAIHWAIGIVCHSLMKTKIPNVHHVYIVVPFFIPEKAFNAPDKLIDVFSKIASIKKDREIEQKVKEHLECLKELTVEKYTQKLKDYNSECYNLDGKKDDLWTRLANSNPHMRKPMQRALSKVREQKINVTVMKTGHSCSKDIGYCENCDSHISPEGEDDLKQLSLCGFVSKQNVWTFEHSVE